MDDRPFTLTEIRSHRNDERLRDETWVECQECGGSGIIESDPYGFGPSSICDDCSGAGGHDGEPHCPECGDELGETDHCESCEVDVNPVFQ